MYLCNLIIVYLSDIFEKVANLKKESKFLKVNKVNKSNIIKGVFKIIGLILRGKLTAKIINNFTNSYVKYHKIIKQNNKPRISKTPFSKWYVKGHYNKSYDKLIVNSLLKKDTTSLNKNIKLKYNKSIIKQINI